MKILATGFTGLVGTAIQSVLASQYEFKNISRSTGVDITNSQHVRAAMQNTDASVILHLAAKANVDACEKDKEAGESGEAWKINVIGTQNIIEACKESKKKLLFISTDFVFSGEQTPESGYGENDQPDPVNWYAKTKAEGENRVKNSGLDYLILRIAFPYTYFSDKNHFALAIFNRLKNNQAVAAVTDEKFTPTWLDDLAKSIDLLIKRNESGIFHIGGKTSVTPFDVANEIAEKWGFDKGLISKTNRANYFIGKAKRPFNTSLNSAKIEKLDLSLTSFSDSLEKIASRIAS